MRVFADYAAVSIANARAFGHAMYLASGYRDVEEVDAKPEDGTPFPLVRMENALT